MKEFIYKGVNLIEKPAEIIVKYIEAKDKKKAIEDAARRNDCTKSFIAQKVLEENGLDGMIQKPFGHGVTASAEEMEDRMVMIMLEASTKIAKETEKEPEQEEPKAEQEEPKAEKEEVPERAQTVQATAAPETAREEVLKKALVKVTGHRERECGWPERNFSMIAELWQTYLGDVRITGTDVAMMMALLKIARIRGGNATEDGFVDLAGYAACGKEAFDEEN